MPRITMSLEYEVRSLNSFPLLDMPVTVITDEQNHMLIVSQKSLDRLNVCLNVDEDDSLIVTAYDNLLQCIMRRCNDIKNITMLRHAQEDSTLHVMIPHFMTLIDGVNFLRNCESVVYHINEISEPFANVNLLWNTIAQQNGASHERTMSNVEWDSSSG